MSNNYEIVYGDSVSGETQIKVNDKYVTIESLFTDVTYTIGDKEYCKLNCHVTDVIGNDGCVHQYDIKYVMRHKTDKKMYRVWFGNTNHIDVTEDHSLITFKKDRFVEIKPTDKSPSVVWESCSLPLVKPSHYNTTVCEFLGFFMGDGSVIYKNEISKYGWLACGKDLEEIEQKLLIPLKQQGMITSYYRKKKGDICFSGKKILSIIDEHIKTPHGKQFPQFILNDTIQNQKAFMRGFFSADGTVMIRDSRPIVRLTSVTTEHIINAQRCLLNCGISSNWFTETRENSYNGKFSGTHSKHLVVKDVKSFHPVGFLIERKHQRLGEYVPKKNDICIVRPTKIEQIRTPDYVYDIEVSDVHRFFGNHILLHNTDSVAVSNVPSIEDGIRLEGKVNDALLEWARKHGVKDEFAPVVKFEKYFKKMFFKKRTGGEGAAKKKYVGHLVWKDGKDKDEISYTGIETKRSDTAPITKECMENFFQKVLLDGKPDEAVTAVKKTFNDVKAGRVSCHAIAIPKAVHSKTVVNPHTKGMAAGTALMGTRFDASKKPKLLYCKSPCTEICIDDNTDEAIIKEKITIDYDKMADRTIAQKMRSLIESLGYDWNESAHGQTKLNFGDKV